jgi:hypothetical protein
MSETAIMNMALDLLEEEPILSPDDDRAAVRWMDRNYAPVRDALLRSHPWNFAIKRASLPILTDAPTSGWSYAYQLPSDCLRILPLAYSGYLNGRSLQYALEGRTLVSDEAAPLVISYIARVTDDAQMDPMFVQALAASLAARAASWLTGKQGVREAMQQMATQLTMQAQMVDSLEGSPAEAETDSWIDGRVTGVV